MKKLNEQSMNSLENHIPELAEGAVKRAYLKTLTSGRNVVEAVDGKLIVTRPNGSTKILKSLHKPIAVTPGLKLSRKR